jgi:hypothetical protein
VLLELGLQELLHLPPPVADLPHEGGGSQLVGALPLLELVRGRRHVVDVVGGAGEAVGDVP